MIIGVTGSLASGKSTVTRMLVRPGAKIIDADQIAHAVISPKSPVYKKIIKAFGRDILEGDKRNINRRKLADLVFSDKRLLLKLNCLVHPEIIRVIKREIKDSKAKTLILDAPLLIEAGLHKIVDKLVVVKIDRKKQLARARNKSALTNAQILRRIKSQMPLRDKVRLADFVIDNSGTIEKTREQVGKIGRKLWRN